MYNLTINEAILLVRKNFDEQPLNDSDMLFPEDKDNTEFETLLAKVLPEAINEVHQAAPISLLDGVVLSADDLQSVTIKADVLSFVVGVKNGILRLVAFQAADSDYIITEAFPEDSSVGRMQLNPYTRGTYDNPVLIQKQLKDKAGSNFTEFDYFSLLSVYPDAESAIKAFSYIPRYKYDESATAYDVADQVVDKVLYQVTAKMCAIYGNNNGATYFYELASFGGTKESKE